MKEKGGLQGIWNIRFFLLNKACINANSEHLTTEVYLIFTFSSLDDKERWNFAVLHKGNAAMALCTATVTKVSKIQIGSDTNPSMNLSPAFSTLVFLLMQSRMWVTVLGPAHSKAEIILQLSGSSVVASGNFLRNKALIQLEWLICSNQKLSCGF